MKYIFFDLDGTLIDSKTDLANSINAAFSYFSLPILSEERIYSFVGNGVRKLVENALKFVFAEDKFDQVMRYFLDNYSKHLLDSTVLYDGILEVLERFYKTGKKMFVVSNKSLSFAIKILESLGVDGFFDEIVGGDSFEHRKPHPQPIFELAEKYRIDLRHALMVGDSENDIETARASDIKMAWVAYGFRDKSILNRYRVDYIIEKPRDLMAVVS